MAVKKIYNYEIAHEYIMQHPEGVKVKIILQMLEGKYGASRNAVIIGLTTKYKDVYEDDNDLLKINYDILAFNQRQNELNEKFRNIKRTDLMANDLIQIKNTNEYKINL